MSSKTGTVGTVEAHSGRLLALDVLRGVAALLVLFFHYTVQFDKIYGHPAGIVLLPYGQYGIDLFFIISGFVIFMTLENTRRGLDFVVSRFSRLFPAYWAAIGLTFCVVLLAGLPGRDVSAAQALVNLSMLQAFFFVPYVDGVYWTLSLELSFYAIMLILYQMNLLSRINVIAIAWLILVLVVHVMNEILGIKLPSRLEIVSLSRYAHLFIAGMMIYKVWREGFDFARVAILVACMLIETWFYGIAVGVLATVFVLAVQSAVHGLANWLVTKPLVFFGTISYTLYLTHQNIGYVMLRKAYSMGLNPYLGIFLAATIAVCLAAAVTFLVERPAMRGIRQVYRRWQARSTSVP